MYSLTCPGYDVGDPSIRGRSSSGNARESFSKGHVRDPAILPEGDPSTSSWINVDMLPESLILPSDIGPNRPQESAFTAITPPNGLGISILGVYKLLPPRVILRREAPKPFGKHGFIEALNVYHAKAAVFLRNLAQIPSHKGNPLIFRRTTPHKSPLDLFDSIHYLHWSSQKREIIHELI
ncbi:unnamed protein product [Linum trigynum]|uniref:Uncharacterized protein n=1 Tax=Linum trigynum TaxID=586398 RepID=A0AAV2CLM4_9ROSI